MSVLGMCAEVPLKNKSTQKTMYYLESVHSAKEEVRRRKEQRGTIRTMLNQHIKARFGIEDYSSFVRNGLAEAIVGTEPVIDETKSYGVLARQIPGLCSEDVACYLLARRLGLVPMAIA